MRIFLDSLRTLGALAAVGVVCGLGAGAGMMLTLYYLNELSCMRKTVGVKQIIDDDEKMNHEIHFEQPDPSAWFVPDEDAIDRACRWEQERREEERLSRELRESIHRSMREHI